MARTIAQRRIGGRALASRKIATAQSAGFDPYVTTFPPGSWTFNAPASGLYKFVAWGCGAVNSNSSGHSGSYLEKKKYLGMGQSVSMVVARASSGGAGVVDTTLTFPDGTGATAGSAVVNGSPGTATGGDVNLNGSSGGDTGAAAGV